MASEKGINHWADVLVIVLYFVIVLAVGLWTLCRPNRGSVKNYFLAGRSMTWITVGASLYSSNIGSEHFIGLGGAGAASGIALVLFEWLPAVLILSLSWLFLPVYISAGVYTLPEYIEKRYGGRRIRTYLSCFALIIYVLNKLSVSIFAGTVFIQTAMGWNMYLSIAILLLFTGLYTILGGLTAVMFTDTFQTFVMLIGAFIVMGFSFDKVGGYEALQEKYMHSFATIRNENSTCGAPNPDAFHVFLDPITGDYPWPAMILQPTLGAFWYWCCDQVIVQRTLAAKNLSHAKGGSIMAAYLKILPLFFMVFPGMISRILFPDEVACSDTTECMKVCGNPSGCSNIAYPKLVMEILPVGLRGFMLAVILSAIMSSLTSIFNSASTVFTMDIWRRIRPKATQRELLGVGRLFLAILCGATVLWLPLVKASQGGRLFAYVVCIDALLSSPLGILFIFSIFWTRATEPAAFWSLLIVQLIGLVRLILEFIYPAPGCGELETRPAFLYLLHYQYFGIILLVLIAVLIVTISLLTKPCESEQLTGVTWWTRYKGSCEPNNIELDQFLKGDEDKTSKSEQHHNETMKDIKDVTTIQESNEEDSSKLKRYINIICGMQETSETTEIEISHRQDFLKEQPIHRKILNINALIFIAVVFFVIGWYH